ncbi:DUF2358 domain-containing protein [Okeania sp. KiyG1]|uniref:DUF2358 domain-containing protein n=1 Tax=Okeania sp. KiyG1 TaxID=2720165 RepID=UPI0035C890CF
MKVEQVINTLNLDLPTLFEKDISYDIYTKNIFLKTQLIHSSGSLIIELFFGLCAFMVGYFSQNSILICTMFSKQKKI